VALATEAEQPACPAPIPFGRPLYDLFMRRSIMIQRRLCCAIYIHIHMLKDLPKGSPAKVALFLPFRVLGSWPKAYGQEQDLPHQQNCGRNLSSFATPLGNSWSGRVGSNRKELGEGSSHPPNAWLPLKDKLCLNGTHLTFALDAHIQAAGTTAGSILDPRRQLHNDALLVVMLRLLGIPASRLPGNVFDEMRRMSPADGEYIYIFCTMVIHEFNGKGVAW